jgi:hypothetical protein
MTNLTDFDLLGNVANRLKSTKSRSANYSDENEMNTATCSTLKARSEASRQNISNFASLRVFSFATLCHFYRN